MISNNDSPIVEKIAGCCELLETHLDHNTRSKVLFTLFMHRNLFIQINFK